MPVQAVFPDFNLVELELSVKVHFKVRWCAVANTTYKSTLQSDNTKSVNWTNLISLGYFKGKCQNIKLHLKITGNLVQNLQVYLKTTVKYCHFVALFSLGEL